MDKAVNFSHKEIDEMHNEKCLGQICWLDAHREEMNRNKKNKSPNNSMNNLLVDAPMMKM